MTPCRLSSSTLAGVWSPACQSIRSWGYGLKLECDSSPSLQRMTPATASPTPYRHFEKNWRGDWDWFPTLQRSPPLHVQGGRVRRIDENAPQSLQNRLKRVRWTTTKVRAFEALRTPNFKSSASDGSASTSNDDIRRGVSPPL